MHAQTTSSNETGTEADTVADQERSRYRFVFIAIKLKKRIWGKGTIVGSEELHFFPVITHTLDL